MPNTTKYAQGPKYNPGALVIQGTVTVLTDNSYDLGVNAGPRMRNIYASGVVDAQGIVGAISGTAAVAGGSQAMKLGSTSARGVYVGSGAPTVAAAVGSFYIRTDGSATNNRLYVNTDGASAWASITTSS